MPSGREAQAQLAVVLSFADQGMAAGLVDVNRTLGAYTSAQDRATKAVQEYHMSLRRGSAVVRAYQRGISAITNTLRGVVSGVGGLTTAIMGVGIAMAGADSIQHAFRDSLKQSGLDATKVVDDLSEASLGLVSTTTLMQRTNQAIGFMGRDAMQRYAKESKRAADMTGVLQQMLTGSMALARSTGMDVERVFSNMMLGAARFDTVMLRTIGIQTSMEEASARWAEKTGKAVVTAEDKMMAFLDIVIEQGQKAVDEFGISTGGIGTQLKRIGAGFKDLALVVTQAFDYGLIRPVLQGMAEVVQSLKSLTPVIQRMGEQLDLLPKPVVTFVGSLLSMKFVAELLGPVLGVLEQALAALGISAAAVAVPLGIALAALIAFKQAMATNEEFARWVEGLNLMERATALWNEAAERTTAVFQSWSQALPNLSAELVRIGESIQRAVEAILDADWDGAMQALGDAAISASGILIAVSREIGERVAPLWWNAVNEIGLAVQQIPVFVEGLVDRLAEAWNGVTMSILGVRAEWDTVVIDILLILEGLWHRGVQMLGEFGREAFATLAEHFGKWSPYMGEVTMMATAALGEGMGKLLGWLVGFIARASVTILREVKAWGLALGGFADDHDSWVYAIAGMGKWLGKVSFWILTEGVQIILGAAGGLAMGLVKGFIDALSRQWEIHKKVGADTQERGIMEVGRRGEEATREAGVGIQEVTLAVGKGIVDIWDQTWAAAAARADAIAAINPEMGGSGRGGLDAEKLGRTGSPGSVKPTAPALPDVSAPTFAGGPGGKGGGGGGGGPSPVEKDPLQEAYQAISSIASAISAGIDAIQKMWSEWRGAPPEELWDEVFDVFETAVDRMLELTSGVGPEQAAEARAAADMMSGMIGALTATVSLAGDLVRMRTPNATRLEQVFDFAESIAEFAVEFGEDYTEGSIEEAVKNLTLTTDAAGLVGSWAQAFSNVAKAAMDLEGQRLDVNWPAIRQFAQEALSIAMSLKDQALPGEELPRTLIDARETAELVGSMIQAVGAAGEASQVLYAARWPANLGSVSGFMHGVLDMASSIVDRMRAERGDGLLIYLEDFEAIAESMSAWISATREVAETASSLVGVRWDGSLDSAWAVLESIIDGASRVTDSLRNQRAMAGGGNDLVPHLREVGLLGEVQSPWLQALRNAAQLAEELESLNYRRAAGHTIDLSGLLTVLRHTAYIMGQMENAIQAGLGGKVDANRLTDSGLIAQVLGAWVETLTKVGAAVGAMRGVQAHLAFGGRIDLSGVRDLLHQLSLIGGDFLAGGEEAFGGDLQRNLAASAQIGQTLGVWLAMVGDVSAALESVRLAGAQRVNEGDLRDIFRLLEVIANESYRIFGETMESAGADDALTRSGATAQALMEWVRVIGTADDLFLALRTANALDLDDAVHSVEGYFSVLDVIANKSWELWGENAGKPGFDLLIGQSTKVAQAMGAWLGVVASIGEVSRQLELVREIDPSVWGVIDSVLDRLDGIFERFARRYSGERDPETFLETGIATVRALSSVLGVVADVAAVGRGITSYVRPMIHEWEAVEGGLLVVAGIFQRLVDNEDIGLPKLVLLAEEQNKRWQALASMLGAAAGAIKSVSTIDLVGMLAPTEREWAKVEQLVRDLWTRFTGIADEMMPGSGLAGAADAEEEARRIGAFASIIAVATRSVNDAFGVNFQAQDVVVFSRGAADAIATTIENVVGLVERLEGAWSGGRRDPERDAQMLASYAAMVSAAIRPIADTFALMREMAGRNIPKSLPDVRQIAEFGHELMGIFEELSDPMRGIGVAWGPDGPIPIDPDDIERARRRNERTWEYMRAYLDTVSSGVGTIASIVTTMHKIHENQLELSGLTVTLRRSFEKFTHDTIDFWRDVASDYDYATEEAKRTWERLAGFASMVELLISPLATIVEVQAALLSLKWETIETSSGLVIRRIRDIELGADFMAGVERSAGQMLSAMQSVMKTLPALLDETDQDKLDVLLKQLATRSEYVATIAESVGALVDPILSFFDNPLFVSGPGSNWWTQVRNNRADFMAEQLGLGIIRTVKALSDALNAAFNDLESAPLAPGIEHQAKRLMDTVEAIATALSRIMSLPEWDVENQGPGTVAHQAKILAEGARILHEGLKDFTVAEDLATHARRVEEAVDSLMAALSRIMSDEELDLQRIRDFVEASRMLLGLIPNNTGGGGRSGIGAERGEGPIQGIVIPEIGDEDLLNPPNRIPPGGRLPIVPDPPNTPTYDGGGGTNGSNGANGWQMPDIVLELPVIEINLTNIVDATLTMNGVEIARALRYMEEQRHRVLPDTGSLS